MLDWETGTRRRLIGTLRFTGHGFILVGDDDKCWLLAAHRSEHRRMKERLDGKRVIVDGRHEDVRVLDVNWIDLVVPEPEPEGKALRLLRRILG